MERLGVRIQGISEGLPLVATLVLPVIHQAITDHQAELVARK